MARKRETMKLNLKDVKNNYLLTVYLKTVEKKHIDFYFCFDFNRSFEFIMFLLSLFNSSIAEGKMPCNF